MLKGKIGRKSSSLPYDSAQLGLPAQVPHIEHGSRLRSHDIAAALAYQRRRQFLRDFSQMRLNFAEFRGDLAVPVGLHAQDFQLGLGIGT
jgi:hypothetical protein